MRRYVFLLCLFAVCLIFASCDKKDSEPAPEPTVAPVVFDINNVAFTKKQVILTEAENGVGASYALNKDLETTAYQGTEYAFEPGISPYDREACIRATETILRRIGQEDKLQIYVYTAETYGYTFVENGGVYTCLQDWNAPEYIAALLQGLFGEFCHYGAAYGYAGYLRNAVFGLPLNLCEDGWTFMADENILDLNTLCFRNGLFEGKDVKAAKKLANTFVHDFIKKNGEEAFRTMLMQSGESDGMESLVTALSAFYASRNLNHIPTKLIFRQGGKGYHYIVKSQYAVMYMERDWKDRNPAQLPMYYEGYLHRNYSEIVAYFSTIIREMGQYRSLFGLDSYRNDLRIFYTNHYGNGKNAVYIPNSHSICSPYAGELAMCYIDSMIRGNVLREDWAYNGMCSYFSWYYNHYGNRDMSYTVNLQSNHDALKFYREFRKWMGREIDMNTDFADFCHYYAAAKNYQAPDQGGSDSFVGYLVSRFGEKQTIDILLRSHDFGNITFDELVSDWKQFLNENYRQ